MFTRFKKGFKIQLAAIVAILLHCIYRSSDVLTYKVTMERVNLVKSCSGDIDLICAAYLSQFYTKGLLEFDFFEFIFGETVWTYFIKRKYNDLTDFNTRALIQADFLVNIRWGHLKDKFESFCYISVDAYPVIELLRKYSEDPLFQQLETAFIHECLVTKQTYLIPDFMSNSKCGK